MSRLKLIPGLSCVSSILQVLTILILTRKFRQQFDKS